MERKIDYSEQYSRRKCVRLIGTPLPQDKKEKAAECLKKVKQILEKLQEHVSDKCIDRAQRIGQVKEIKDDQRFSTYYNEIHKLVNNQL